MRFWQRLRERCQRQLVLRAGVGEMASAVERMAWILDNEEYVLDDNGNVAGFRLPDGVVPPWEMEP